MPDENVEMSVYYGRALPGSRRQQAYSAAAFAKPGVSSSAETAVHIIDVVMEMNVYYVETNVGADGGGVYSHILIQSSSEPRLTLHVTLELAGPRW
jgi:hypothetical protein